MIFFVGYKYLNLDLFICYESTLNFTSVYAKRKLICLLIYLQNFLLLLQIKSVTVLVLLRRVRGIEIEFRI